MKVGEGVINMKLWIRSQDKKIFTPISEELQVKRLNYVETPEERYFVLYKKLDLGSYKTEKRALEVLDEIQNILKPKFIINQKSMKFSNPYEENGMVLMDCNADARLEQLSTYVYEMPKE